MDIRKQVADSCMKSTLTRGCYGNLRKRGHNLFRPLPSYPCVLSLLLSLFVPFPLVSFLSCPFPYLSCCKVTRLNPATGSGECCKLLQQVWGWSLAAEAVLGVLSPGKASCGKDLGSCVLNKLANLNSTQLGILQRGGGGARCVPLILPWSHYIVCSVCSIILLCCLVFQTAPI